MADNATTTAAGEEILGARALNYRKVTIGTCVVLMAMYALPSINFNNLNLFGLTLAGEGAEQRSLVLKVVWLFLLYHFFPWQLRGARLLTLGVAGDNKACGVTQPLPLLLLGRSLRC